MHAIHTLTLAVLKLHAVLMTNLQIASQEQRLLTECVTHIASSVHFTSPLTLHVTNLFQPLPLTVSSKASLWKLHVMIAVFETDICTFKVLKKYI